MYIGSFKRYIIMESSKQQLIMNEMTHILTDRSEIEKIVESAISNSLKDILPNIERC